MSHAIQIFLRACSVLNVLCYLQAVCMIGTVPVCQVCEGTPAEWSHLPSSEQCSTRLTADHLPLSSWIAVHVLSQPVCVCVYDF